MNGIDVLPLVEKPSRYTGGEWNSVKKDWQKINCHVALSIPDVYEVGMSNLGIKILYEVLNAQENVCAERVFAPWLDMEKILREKNLPLCSLESQTPLKNFDFVGFNLQYELCYSNLLMMLDLANISIWQNERKDDEPFIIAGGPCAYNPEPIADFIDFFVIGEGEEVLLEVVDAFLQWKQEKKSRQEFLKRVSQIKGIYVPSLYKSKYDGKNFLGYEMLDENAPKKILKRVVKDLNQAFAMENPIVPFMDVVHNRIMLELFRGCSRGCRFCQASMIYRPVREREPQKLRELAKKMLASTGYEEISLTSLSSADYSCLKSLVDSFFEDFKNDYVSFSLPSLRLDSFSIDLAEKLQQVRKNGLTLAPEAGTQRLRDVINKNVTEENLRQAVEAAYRAGWTSIKLYFMIGLPTETDDDVRGIANLAKKCVALYYEIFHKKNHRLKITVSVSNFVPKPVTPFQFFPQNTLEEFERKQKILKEELKDCRSIQFKYHDAKTSFLEGVFARGDRRLAKIIFDAWQMGAKFDGWSEYFSFEIWQKSFEKNQIDPTMFNQKNYAFEENFPWEIVSSGVNKKFLVHEYQKALAEQTTQDCRRTSCTGCGVCQNLHVNVIDYAGGERNE